MRGGAPCGRPSSGGNAPNFFGIVLVGVRRPLEMRRICPVLPLVGVRRPLEMRRMAQYCPSWASVLYNISRILLR